MKKVLITGGSRGIGRATVEMLAKLLDENNERKYEIHFTYNSKSEEANEIIAKYTNVKAYKLNLLNIDDINSFLTSNKEIMSKLDIIVHNAGICKDNLFYFLNEEEWKMPIDLALNSFYYLTKASLSNMIQNRFGRIITLVSLAGEAGNKAQTNYAAAKGALIAATKSLAREYASKGVLANAVSPGLIDTEMIANLPLSEIKKMIPIGRVGKATEVASLIKFLISEESSYITGEVIRINGGFYT